MKVFKKLIPVAFFALAIVGAFTTHAMSNNTSKKGNVVTTFQGYLKGNVAGTICNKSIECTDDAGQLCKSGGVQVWGMDGSNKCVVELHRIP